MRRTRSPAKASPVGAAEIAMRLGVKLQTVDRWRRRKLMPPPRWTVSGRPAWEWTAIEAWARSTERMSEGDAYPALLELEGLWTKRYRTLRSVPRR